MQVGHTSSHIYLLMTPRQVTSQLSMTVSWPKPDVYDLMKIAWPHSVKLIGWYCQDSNDYRYQLSFQLLSTDHGGQGFSAQKCQPKISPKYQLHTYSWVVLFKPNLYQIGIKRFRIFLTNDLLIPASKNNSIAANITRQMLKTLWGEPECIFQKIKMFLQDLSERTGKKQQLQLVCGRLLCSYSLR